jgi:hypothetical protein
MAITTSSTKPQTIDFLKGLSDFMQKKGGALPRL